MNFKAIANEWFKAQCQDACSALYLYFKRSNGAIPGDIKIAVEAPEGYELADQRRISPAWTAGQAENFVQSVYQHLPVLPTAGPVDVSYIKEYGLTRKLSNSVRVF